MEETRITTKEIQKTQELIDFIKKSPSCYHVIHNIAAELEEAPIGFRVIIFTVAILSH